MKGVGSREEQLTMKKEREKPLAKARRRKVVVRKPFLTFKFHKIRRIMKIFQQISEGLFMVIIFLAQRTVAINIGVYLNCPVLGCSWSGTSLVHGPEIDLFMVMN